MTGRRESTELEDRRGSEVMDGSLSRAVGPSQRDGWPQAEDTSLQHILSLSPPSSNKNPTAPAFPPGAAMGSLPRSGPSLSEGACRHLNPAGCEGSELSPSLGGHWRRWLSVERRWHGHGGPWLPLDAWGLSGKASHLWVL